jgi:predicted nicotinamide N-methyase
MMCRLMLDRLDLVERLVDLPGRRVALLCPRDPESLLDEAAFAHEEFLPYWAELWPSAHALAHAVCDRTLAGVPVAELGCGLGLPSIAAALGDARVLATDWAPDAIELLRVNAARNGAALRAERCTWSEGGPLVAGAPWPLVLAADVLYEARNVEPLLALLPRLVDGEGEVLLADPGRAPAQRFLAEAGTSWTVTPLAREGGVTVHRMRRRGAPG